MDTKFFADNRGWIMKEVGKFLEENQPTDEANEEGNNMQSEQADNQ
jgi:hypothetical protein